MSWWDRILSLLFFSCHQRVIADYCALPFFLQTNWSCSVSSSSFWRGPCERWQDLPHMDPNKYGKWHQRSGSESPNWWKTSDVAHPICREIDNLEPEKSMFLFVSMTLTCQLLWTLRARSFCYRCFSSRGWVTLLSVRDGLSFGFELCKEAISKCAPHPFKGSVCPLVHP